MGDFCYFLCLEDVITIDELPDRWGLLWVNERRRITGPTLCLDNIRVAVYPP